MRLCLESLQSGWSGRPHLHLLDSGYAALPAAGNAAEVYMLEIHMMGPHGCLESRNRIQRRQGWGVGSLKTC